MTGPAPASAAQRRLDRPRRRPPARASTKPFLLALIIIFAALLLAAVGSTMLTIPVVSPALRRLESLETKAG